ncbi:MAG: hypothetical protein K6L73_08180 [Cellvibrionaceae bacterium]
MRRFLLWLVGALCAGGLLYQFIAADSGYVLIAYGDYALEMTLWALAVVLLAAGFCVWLFWRLASGTLGFTSGVFAGLSSRKQRKARKETTEGILDYLEGYWSRARQRLEKAAPHSETPMLNYLVAAHAASAQGKAQLARENLAKAEKCADKEALVIEITKGRLHLLAGRYEAALAAFMRCREKAPKHPVVLNLLHKVYLKLEAWSDLMLLLPNLKDADVLTKEEYNSLIEKIYFHQLENFLEPVPVKVKEADELWLQMPKALKRKAPLLEAYILILREANREQDAEQLLKEFLKRDWDGALINLYGLVAADDVAKQLLLAETWLRERPGDAGLLLTLGRLCLRNELWGKAKEYFNSAIEQGRGAEAYAEQARLLAHMGEYEASNQYYQQGLMVSARKLSELPQPHLDQTQASGS